MTTIIPSGTLLYHGTYSDQIVIEENRDTLYFGFELLPSLGILTEKQYDRNSLGRLFIYETLVPLTPISMRNMDVYFLKWMKEDEDRHKLNYEELINKEAVAGMTMGSEVVLHFNSHADFLSKLKLQQTCEIEMNDIYNYLDTLPPLPEEGSDIMASVTRMLAQMEISEQIEKFMTKHLRCY